MSGPIVRKYGFPNFDQIFGKKEIEHGIDEPEPSSETKSSVDEAAKPSSEEKKPAPDKK